MEDQQFYTCKYCYKQFEPARRRVQKYCSDTCRSKAYHFRKANNKKTSSLQLSNPKLPTLTPKPTNKMSLAGIGNATAGSLAADAIKSIATPNDNKPATKGDLKKMVSEINGRYHLVRNLPPRFDGAMPYFDLDSNMIVYQ